MAPVFTKLLVDTTVTVPAPGGFVHFYTPPFGDTTTVKWITVYFTTSAPGRLCIVEGSTELTTIWAKMVPGSDVLGDYSCSEAAHIVLNAGQGYAIGGPTIGGTAIKVTLSGWQF